MPGAISSARGAFGTMAVRHWPCSRMRRRLCHALLLSGTRWLMWQVAAGLSCHVSMDGDVPAMSAVESWRPSDASLRLQTHRWALRDSCPLHLVSHFAGQWKCCVCMASWSNAQETALSSNWRAGDMCQSTRSVASLQGGRLWQRRRRRQPGAGAACSGRLWTSGACPAAHARALPGRCAAG